MMIVLQPSQTWSADVDRSGVEVRIASGEVWITRERDPDDHLLSAPATFESRSRGRLVVLALTAARLEVLPLTRPAAAGERLAHAASR